MAEKEEKKKEEGKEAEGQAPAADAAASSGGKKKLLMIGGFVALLLIAAGVPTVIMLMRKAPATTEVERAEAGAETAALAPESGAEGEEIGDDEERLGAIAPLETFVVNLAGGRFLRVQVQLEFVDVDIPSRFVSRAVPIRDGIIALLTKRSAADLDSSKGREDLKTDIKSVVNELIRKEDVKQVYFTQFVIQ